MNERWMFIYHGMQAWSSVIQALAAIIAVYAGLKYVHQHKTKLRIEREHRFAEKMIELIYAIDLQMSELFNDKTLDKPEWKEEVKRIDEITDGFTILGYHQMRYFYRRHLAVKANQEIVWPKIISLSKELNLYIGYFEGSGLSFRKTRMIFAAKGILDWAVKTFPKLMADKRESTEEFIIYFFKTIVPKFPDTMYVQTPYVISYEKNRDKLTEMVFKILEK